MTGSIPKLLIGIGVIFIVSGILISLAGKIPFVGKLPGDIYIRRDNFTFYFPFATCLLVSVLLTLLAVLFGKK